MGDLFALKSYFGETEKQGPIEDIKNDITDRFVKGEIGDDKH